jgi:Putative stress-induced transcription regulator
MAVNTASRGRFAVAGEPIVAVDLINTVAAPGSSAGGDLLSVGHGAEAWWRIESARVPGGDLPDIQALHRLRAALRAMIEALVDGQPVPQAAVADLNFFMRSAPASTRLVPTETGLLMVRGRGVRQPGPRRPALPSRGRALTEVRAG